MGRILQHDKSPRNGIKKAPSRKRTGVRKPRQALLISSIKSNGVESKERLLEEPPHYIHIQSNEFLHRGHKKQKEEDIAVCECKYEPDDPESMCGDRCLNVLTSTECTPNYCPCSDHCKNQRFQRCEYVKTKLFKTDGRGWGLLADQDIKAGQFVIEYCGEVISCKEARKRSQMYEATGLKDAYIISLNRSELIDATQKGSLARFINHSCEPNCETRKWTVLGEIRVGIFTKQDISCGTELSYDYNFEWFGGAKVRCLCGASSCLGFLGAKSRGFQNDAYLWEDNDERYSVENVPLYDSDEDEPLSNFLKRAKICKKLKRAAARSHSNTQHTIAMPRFGPESQSSVSDQKELPASNGSVNEDKLCLMDLADVAISNEDKETFNSVANKIQESAEMESDTGHCLNEISTNGTDKLQEVVTVSKEMAIDMKVKSFEAGREKNGMKIGGDEYCEDKNGDGNRTDNGVQGILDSETLLKSKKSLCFSCQKSEASANKRVDDEQVGHISTTKELHHEILKVEQTKNTAADNLNSIYAKIRPVIEEHGKDGQHSVPTRFAEEWIKADCDNLKATFDFHFSIIKNMPIQILSNDVLIDQTNGPDKAD